MIRYKVTFALLAAIVLWPCAVVAAGNPHGDRWGQRAADAAALGDWLEALEMLPPGRRQAIGLDLDPVDLVEMFIQVGVVIDIPEGYMIIEGDIVVPEDFYENRGTYATNLWPGGIVPYEFDSNVVQQSWKDNMHAAMAEWEAVANVDFQHCPNDDCGTFEDHLHIQNSTMNTSMVGQAAWMWEQEVNIVSWNGWDGLPGTADDPFIIAHELGHALGFWHEQSRANRDDFLIIYDDPDTGRICPGYEDQFQIRDDQGPYGSGEYPPGAFDFDSVMCYGVCYFSDCCDPCTSSCTGCAFSCQTMEVRNNINIPYPDLVGCSTSAACSALMGQRTHLSHFDALTMSFLYPAWNWQFVDRDFTGEPNGSFLQPWPEFDLGYVTTPVGGTLWVQPGNYSATITYFIPMTIRAPLGGVVIGQRTGS